MLCLLPLLFRLLMKCYFILYSPSSIEFLTKDVLKCLGLISFPASSWCLEREKLKRNENGNWCVLISLCSPRSECEPSRQWERLYMWQGLCFGEALTITATALGSSAQQWGSPWTAYSFQFFPRFRVFS